MGAWIEIKDLIEKEEWVRVSHPSWVRGLKYEYNEFYLDDWTVAPLVGAWIEIYSPNIAAASCFAAPLVGAWIEI